MPRLLVGTTNPAKFSEVCEILRDENLEILGLKDFPDIRTVWEDGDTFEENAVRKAKSYYTQSGIPCVADDGGLMVDYLGGAPGVHSHRWLGHKGTDQELAEAVLEKLRGVPRERRMARLGGCMAFYDGEHLLKQENYVEGYIAEGLLDDIEPGFPYRPVFIVSRFNKPFSMLTDEESREVGARPRNLRALKLKILELLK